MKSTFRHTYFLLLALAACGTDDGPTTGTDASGDATATASPDAGSDSGTADAPPGPDASTLPDAQLIGEPAPAGLVVVHSDYMSTSISLLNDTGAVTHDDCIHSGSVNAKLSLALSGDVVTPSQRQPDNEVALIDRSNATITYVSPVDCAPLRQVSVATGFRSNPHDVVSLGRSKAYVTRYEPNGKPTATPSDFDEGGDVLIIDPTTGRATGRIELAPLAVPDAAGKPTLPRPDRAVRIGTRVYVSLNNLSADFKSSGTGRLVVIETSNDRFVGVIDLPGLKNCGGLRPTPGAPGLLVACGGAFSDGAKQIDGAGMVWVDLSAAAPVLTTVPSSAFGGRVLNGFTAAARTRGVAFAVTNGDFGGPVFDQLWVFSFDGGTPRKLFDSTQEFTLADVVVREDGTLAFLTDASATAPRIHVFDASNPAGVTFTRSVRSGQLRGLPPRSMSWF